MAPKTSQRISLGSSQPQPFQAAITKFCKAIDEAKIHSGEIKAESLVNKIRDFLKDYRRAGKILGSETVTQLIPSLENDGTNICSCLDPATFSTVVEIALQSEGCIDGERSLYLLAQSLFEDAKAPEDEEVVHKRKNDIGKGCLQQLLRYFLDSEVASTMRRWAGALCIQLFQDSEENCSWLELGPDELRQNIGRLVLDEPDEILKIFYAQLVRTLHQADITLKDLFPADFAEEIYVDFPPSTQEGFGWGGSFQKYMDSLYQKNIIEIPESIGNLYFGSTVTMLPERTFGVPGHNVYIFVREEELIILSPAQSTLFDQILDLPLRSIKRISIMTDEYSQLASAIGLELRSGKGHDIFLNSKQIQLKKICITCLPGHVEHFKDELIGSCPSLEAIETDKKSALNPASSDDRDSAAPQSSVTEEVFVGSQPGRQPIRKRSSKPSEAPQLKTNSIPETQVEKDNKEKGINAENKLQNSVHAVNPAAQDEDHISYGATPQATEEPSKEAPAKNASDFKPRVPPGTRKVVKPKAKAPLIVQRGLRSKANQEAPKDAASQTWTRAKQQRTESGDKAQQSAGSQDTKVKQREPELIPAAQHSFKSQQKRASGASSQAKGTKQPARLSQITDDIEDSDVLEKAGIQSKAASKASFVPTRANPFPSKHVPGQPTDDQQNKPQVKGPQNLLPNGEDQEYQQFSDDYITTPGEMDASTPITCWKTPAAQKQQRYSLNPAPKPAVSDMYDISVDDNDDDGGENGSKTKSKKSTNTGKSSTTANGKSRKQGTKADAKKRQSAPAVLDRPVPKRNSQRAAAAKARAQLRDVEDADAVGQAASPRPKTLEKSKSNSGQGKTKIISEEKVRDEVPPAIEQEKQTSPLPQQDPTPSSLVRDDQIDADNLYDATPKSPSRKSVAQNIPEIVDKLNVADIQSAVKQYKRVSYKRDPAADFSLKLGNLIGRLSDDEAERGPLNVTVRKELEDSVEPIIRKPGKESNFSVPTAKNAVDLTTHKSIGAKNKEKGSTVEIWEVSDNSSALSDQEDQSDVSPPAPAPVAVPEQKTSPPLAKTPSKDGKTFKKPNIPAGRKKTLNRPNKGDPSTCESKSTDRVVQDEPDRYQASRQVNDDVHVEAAEASSLRVKRAGELDTKTPHKKQRTDAGRNHMEETSSSSPIPSSPPVRAKPDSKQPNKSQHSTEKTSTARRSPRLMERPRKATKVLHQTTAGATSVTKDPDRKPHLVSFGGKGALNQGVSSVAKVRQSHPEIKDVSEKASKQTREDVKERKRKRERVEIADQDSPPKKRQSTSPSEVIVVDGHEGDDLPFLQDSSAIATIKTKSTQTRRAARPPTRPSSQTSRVDKNGSPIASSQENHFERLRERLAEDWHGNVSQIPVSASVVSSPVQQRRISQVFGPKVMLDNKTKARVSSPEEIATRYVAHEKNGTGVYQGVATKHVITQEKKLQDPFTDQARKASDFTERLVSGSSTEKRAIIATGAKEIVFKNYKSKPQKDKLRLPSHPRGVSKANPLAEPTGRTQQGVRRERARVEIDNQHSYDQSMPSDMTTGTSCESQSSEPSRMPPSERPTANDIWNVVIRPPPHYASLHDAIHRIADELIIRLTDEEQRMGLLVEQYKQEGGKILGKLEQRHENQRVTIMQALDHKKGEMVSIYSEEKELVLESTNDLKENSTSQFEREWRKRQDVIRAEISEGRKISEI